VSLCSSSNYMYKYVYRKRSIQVKLRFVASLIFQVVSSFVAEPLVDTCRSTDSTAYTDDAVVYADKNSGTVRA
jgi:hypothetical protein